MLKRVLLSGVVILFVSAGAFADIVIVGEPLPGSIYQHQSFAVGNAESPGISSIVSLVHGNASASSRQFLDIKNTQNSPEKSHYGNVGSIGFGDYSGGPVVVLDLDSYGGDCGGCPDGDQCKDSCETKANQCQDADLDQIVNAKGNCGIITVSSFLDAGGNQGQFIGSSVSPKLQEQSLGVVADQLLFRSDGGGSGDATNRAEMTQKQGGSNAAGSMQERSYIDADQMAEMRGKPNSTVTIVNGMMANTSQVQTVF